MENIDLPTTNLKYCHSVCRGQEYHCSRCAANWGLESTKPKCLTSRELGLKWLSHIKMMLRS